MIYIGNSKGEINSYGCEKEFEFKNFVNSEYSGIEVTCITLSKTGEYMLVGLKNGWIALWSCKRNACKKLIKTIFSTAVLDCKFLDNNKKTYSFIASDSQGNVHKILFEFGFFSDEVSYESLIKLDYPVYNIDIIFKNEENKKLMLQQGSDTIACFVCLNMILVCNIEPTLKKIFKFEKPKYYKDGQYVPNVSFGIGYIPYYTNESTADTNRSVDTSYLENTFNYSKPQLLLAVSWGIIKYKIF